MVDILEEFNRYKPGTKCVFHESNFDLEKVPEELKDGEEYTICYSDHIGGVTFLFLVEVIGRGFDSRWFKFFSFRI